MTRVASTPFRLDDALPKAARLGYRSAKRARDFLRLLGISAEATGLLIERTDI
ncbi:MAG: hypothetical protein K2P68_09045 [Sphingomonas sp.]|nr:hypothetical protein [Sphingomonas sp.]